jgi:nucleoside-diphosphate-sugar epimerase
MSYLDEPKKRVLDFTKARSILGWKPKVRLSGEMNVTNDYFKSLSILGLQ